MTKIVFPTAFHNRVRPTKMNVASGNLFFFCSLCRKIFVSVHLIKLYVFEITRKIIYCVISTKYVVNNLNGACVWKIT